MLHSARVDIALLWCESQVRELIEGNISVRDVLVRNHPSSHFHIVFGPLNVHWWRVEVIDKADQGVDDRQFNLIFGVQHNLWCI